jgi:hypothetical protein
MSHLAGFTGMMQVDGYAGYVVRQAQTGSTPPPRFFPKIQIGAD